MIAYAAGKLVSAISMADQAEQRSCHEDTKTSGRKPVFSFLRVLGCFVFLEFFVASLCLVRADQRGAR
jgi:hypothetical protein